MSIQEVLYNSLSTSVYSVGFIAFAIVYFWARQKKDLYWSALFLVNLSTEVFGNLYNIFPALWSDTPIPYLVSVASKGGMTLFYILLIAEQSGLPISRREKQVLACCSAVAFGLLLMTDMQDKGFVLLVYTFYWGVWKTFPVLERGWREKILFWNVTAIAVIQTFSLSVVLCGNTAMYPHILRLGSPFELLLPAELIGMIVLLSAVTDFACDIRRLVCGQAKKKVFSLSPEEVARRAKLTRRESEVFALLVAGDTVGQISGKLFITEGTVNVHIHNIYQKLGIRSRAQINALLADGVGITAERA